MALHLVPAAKTGRRPSATYWDDERNRHVRRCKKCSKLKPIEEFRKDKNLRGLGRGYSCTPCERARCKANHHRYRSDLRAKYGISKDEYDAMVAARGGKCEICGTVPGRPLHVDHDHKTGAVRGLLCYTCNSMLGNAKDDPERLTVGANYLRVHHARRG